MQSVIFPLFWRHTHVDTQGTTKGSETEALNNAFDGVAAQPLCVLGFPPSDAFSSSSPPWKALSEAHNKYTTTHHYYQAARHSQAKAK